MSALAAGKIDFSPRPKQPTPASLALETPVSLTGSLAADAILVAIGTRIFPATSGYVHFRFSDHGGLTTAAVIIACVAWPVVTRISTAPHLGVPTYGRPGNGGPAAAGPVHPCQGLAPPSGAPPHGDAPCDRCCDLQRPRAPGSGQAHHVAAGWSSTEPLVGLSFCGCSRSRSRLGHKVVGNRPVNNARLVSQAALRPPSGE